MARRGIDNEISASALNVKMWRMEDWSFAFKSAMRSLSHDAVDLLGLTYRTHAILTEISSTDRDAHVESEHANPAQFQLLWVRGMAALSKGLFSDDSRAQTSAC